MTPAENASLIRSALQLDERIEHGNLGPLRALDDLVARVEELEAALRKLETATDWISPDDGRYVRQIARVALADRGAA